MKKLFLYPQNSISRFVYQETGPEDKSPATDTRERTYAEEIKKYIEKGTQISDALIQAEAARCANTLQDYTDICPLIEKALDGRKLSDINDLAGLSDKIIEAATEGRNIEQPLERDKFDEIWAEIEKNPPVNLNIPGELKDTIASSIIANLETKGLSDEEIQTEVSRMITDEITYHKTLKSIVEGTEGKEPSSVEVPLTQEKFDEIWAKRQKESQETKAGETSIFIPEEFKNDIGRYVIHMLETKDLSDKDIETKTRKLIEEYATFLKINELNEIDLETGERATESTEKTLQKALEEIAKANNIDPQILYRAIAINYEGFGLDNSRNPLAYNKEEYLKNAEALAKKLKEKLGEVAKSNPNIDTTTPQGQAEALNLMGGAPGQNGEFSLLDLFKLFKDIANLGKPGSKATDSSGNPLSVANPRGNTHSPGSMRNIEGHPGSINLNSEFYGEEMKAQYEALPQNYKDAVEKITEGWDEGWSLPVMRHAINAHKQGKPFSADRPFFANDLGTQRALIYIPGKGSIQTKCHGGSGGISNVPKSHGSPLGSFYFQPGDVAFLPNHRYAARATVHGMEPMTQSYKTSYEQGGNIDPAAGNTNTAGRAILMHGSNGTTWGCWGIPKEHAVTFAQAIQEFGGANGEAFVSVAR